VLANGQSQGKVGQACLSYSMVEPLLGSFMLGLMVYKYNFIVGLNFDQLIK
jgi:hypothetical protein